MYEVGNSKKEAKEIIGDKSINRYKEYRNPNSPHPEKIGLNKDVMPLMTHQNIQVWCGCVIKNIRKLDDEVDELFNEVVILGDSTFSSEKKIKKRLNKILDLRESIRNVEIDSEEFINTVSIIDHKLDSTIGQTVLQILSQLNSSYLSTYNLTIYKLKNISNSRVILTNIIISIIAILISISALTKES